MCIYIICSLKNHGCCSLAKNKYLQNKKKSCLYRRACLCTEFRPSYALFRLLSQLCKFAEKTASSLLILQTSQWRLVIRSMLEFDFQSLIINCSNIEGVSRNFRIINGRFKTTSGHFFANYINIFHKTKIQTVILRCKIGLNLNWCKGYDTKRKHFFQIL